MSDDLIPRRGRAATAAAESLACFRAIVIQGAHQAGQSTLAALLAEQLAAHSISLDREEDLTAALDDPTLFLDALGAPPSSTRSNVPATH